MLSSLPVEPALRMGATEIVALDLMDTRAAPGAGDGLIGFLDRLSIAVEKRQTDLELELAQARHIPSLHLPLVPQSSIPLWDFQHTTELMEQGYELARQFISTWQMPQKVLCQSNRSQILEEIP